MFNQEWLNNYYKSIRDSVDTIWWNCINFNLLDESMLRECLPYYKKDAHIYFKKIRENITPNFLREFKEELDIRWIFYEWWRYYKRNADVTYKHFCENELYQYKDLWIDDVKNKEKYEIK